MVPTAAFKATAGCAGSAASSQAVTVAGSLSAARAPVPACFPSLYLYTLQKSLNNPVSFSASIRLG